MRALLVVRSASDSRARNFTLLDSRRAEKEEKEKGGRFIGYGKN